MAIVTISRIQHRRGLYDNLPQLSAAEFGWAADQRRLFIGNGPVSEGAPEVGNTEILTQFSDILDIASTYSFKNEDAGYSPNTGTTANNPTVRTLQKKFDDFVSVKDFGAKGDGSTDDTEAINRALYQLYCTWSFEGARKALYFPAGRYVITDFIKVPSYATLIGEGPYSTIIDQQADPALIGAVFQTADTKQQIGVAIGTTGGAMPSDIYIEDMGLLCNLDGIYVEKCSRITLNRLRIVGKDSLPTSDNTTVIGFDSTVLSEPSIGIWLIGTAIAPTEDVNIIDCKIEKMCFGIWNDTAAEFCQNVQISSGTFTELYEGIHLCVTNGSAKNVVVTTSLFDDIYTSAVNVGDVQNFASSFNYYKNVGNSSYVVTSGSPSTPVIRFGTATQHSATLGDLFDRSDADDLIEARVIGNTNTSYFNYGDHLNVGYFSIENGQEDTLSNNTTGSTSCVVKLSRYDHIQVTYNIKRGNDIRSGTINVAYNSNTSSYSLDDDSTETADVGVTFSISFSSGYATLRYTTTNTGSSARFRYSVMRLNDVV